MFVLMGSHGGYERFENVDVLGGCRSGPFAVTAKMSGFEERKT